MKNVPLRVGDNYACGEIGNKAALEKMNTAVIKRVYQRLKDEDEVQWRIQQIKAHPWAKGMERN